MRLKTFFRSVLMMLVLTAATSCGGKKSKSQQVNIAVLPDTPLVINADLDDTVKKPWTSFTLRVDNNSDEPVTIVAFELEIDPRGDGSTGFTEALGPSEMNTDTCTWYSWGTYLPGESKLLAPAGNCTMNDGVLFTIHSLPSTPNRTTFNYRVKLKPFGWFGTFSNQTDRFNRVFFFSTR